MPCAPGRAAGRSWTLTPPERRQDRAELTITVDQAIAAVAWQLAEAAEEVLDRGGSLDAVHLLEVHRALLIDPLFAGRARRLEADGRSPTAAIQGAVDQAVAELRATRDPLLAARVADIEQLGERLHDALQLKLPTTLERPERPVVLVARDLAPDQLLELLGPAGTRPFRLLRAILLERGGPLTHTSVLARQRGIPLVGGLPGLTDRVLPGTAVLVDGFRGTVVLEPDLDGLRRFHRQRSPPRPAPPRDRPVRVLANLDLPEESALARKRGADGIGLFRTDALLDGRGRAPSQADQARIYAEVLQSWPGQPVIIRTFDAPRPSAPEPSIGTRGVRWLHEAPQRSQGQLRALLQAALMAPQARLCILLPMVSRADEVAVVQRFVQAEWRGAGPPPQVGAMVETPAAALDIDAILDQAELVAIGSNDLLSLLVGASREDPQVARLLDPEHPALWRLVGQIVAATSARGRALVACGAVTADPQALGRLVDLGVRSVSVGLADLGRVRRILSPSGHDRPQG